MRTPRNPTTDPVGLQWWVNQMMTTIPNRCLAVLSRFVRQFFFFSIWNRHLFGFFTDSKIIIVVKTKLLL